MTSTPSEGVAADESLEARAPERGSFVSENWTHARRGHRARPMCENSAAIVRQRHRDCS